jgi:multidrug efflux pump subunit AcrB
MKLNTRKQKPLRHALLKMLDDRTEAVLLTVDTWYAKALDYCLNHRFLVLLFTALLLAYSLMQFGGIGMNLFVRSRTDDNVTVNLTMPQGSTLEAAEALLLDLEEVVKEKVRGYTHLIITARRGGRFSSQGSLQITLPEPALQIDRPQEIIDKLTPFTQELPGVQATYRSGRSMSTTQAVEIALSSRDHTALLAAADEIRNILIRHLPEIENPEIGLSEGGPQLQVAIDRDRAAALGISLSAIASEIRTAFNGTNVTTILMGDQRVNVTVQLREDDRKALTDLDSIFVMGRGGRVTLSNVAYIIENRAPSSIRRENQEEIIRVTGDLPMGMAVTEMQRRLEETVAANFVPREGVSVRYAGEAQEIAAYNRRFMFIILIAVFLVFGLMASQFESFVDPLIIFFSIPLLFIGVVWIYKIGNEPLSVFSMVGVVALVGIVVNNGIVLVDYTNTLRARGLPVRAACVEAGRSRLRPILMTSLTTILGMAPIAFFPGEGADTIQPIGKTFVGGLAVSSFMTLFITPVLYSLFNARHDRKKARVIPASGALAARSETKVLAE